MCEEALIFFLLLLRKLCFQRGLSIMKPMCTGHTPDDNKIAFALNIPTEHRRIKLHQWDDLRSDPLLIVERPQLKY